MVLKYDKNGNRKGINKKTTTNYDGKVFDRYLEHFSQGGSTPEFCRQEKITRQTLDDWFSKYDPSGTIKKKAKLMAEGWWLSQAREHLVIHNDFQGGTTKFDTKLYMHITGGRFGHSQDKELKEAIRKLEERLDSQKAPTQSAYAKEAECIDDTDPE